MMENEPNKILIVIVGGWILITPVGMESVFYGFETLNFII